MINTNINNNWKEIFKIESEKKYFQDILKKLENEYIGEKTIFPKKEEIFNRFLLTDIDKTKVIILWQDPYHWQNEAHWLSFSVQIWTKIPPSLRNIFKELKHDLWIDNQNKWDLTNWTKSWVLLLNSILTVIKDSPASHKNIWWDIFTDNIIKYISEKKENIVFILWWNYAIEKEKLIDSKKHFIIKSPHPSPFSAHRWFFGSKVFSKTNNYLKSKNITEINWTI